MDLAQDMMIKFVVSYVLEHCPEMEFFNSFTQGAAGAPALP